MLTPRLYLVIAAALLVGHCCLSSLTEAKPTSVKDKEAIHKTTSSRAEHLATSDTQFVSAVEQVAAQPHEQNSHGVQQQHQQIRYVVQHELAHQPQQVQYVQTVEQQPQQVQYVQVEQQQPAREMIQYDHVQPSAYHQQQQVIYVQQADSAAHHQHGPDCKHGQAEYQAQPAEQQPAVSQEYPAEIIYMQHEDGRLELMNSSSANQYQPTDHHYHHHHHQPQQTVTIEPTYSAQDVAGAMIKNSGMPATILAEVPLKDMSRDVLVKLRRDYGVKVVATRERPGANLLINCEEYSNQGNSICSRQQRHHQGPATTIEEYHHHHHHHEAAEPIPVVHHEEHHHEREAAPAAYEPYENPATGEIQQEPPRGMYTTRSGETRVVGHYEPAAELDNQHQQERYYHQPEAVYGSRNVAEPSAESHNAEAEQARVPVDTSHQEAEKAVEHHLAHHVQDVEPKSYEQQASSHQANADVGFEAQPPQASSSEAKQQQTQANNQQQ